MVCLQIAAFVFKFRMCICLKYKIKPYLRKETSAMDRVRSAVLSAIHSNTLSMGVKAPSFAFFNGFGFSDFIFLFLGFNSFNLSSLTKTPLGNLLAGFLLQMFFPFSKTFTISLIHCLQVLCFCVTCFFVTGTRHHYALLA